jgi:hypothetical protein
MVQRNAEDSQVEDVKYFAKARYTVILTSNDAFTASDFVSTENLKSVTIVKNVDGTVLTASILNNVITLSTAAVVDQECTLFVFGVRA